MTSFQTTFLSRDILKLSGSDTKPLLQSLLTCNLDHLDDDHSLYGALLTPQGKILETMFLTQVGGDVLIDIPFGRGAALAKKLQLYRLRASMEIEVVTELKIGITPTLDSLPAECVNATRDPRHEELGFRFFIHKDTDLPVHEEEYRIFQTALGIPEMTAGFSESAVFPLDVNLDALNGIDHKKGCFVGQEVASRMFRKGEVRKRTYLVLGASLPQGTTLRQNDRIIGEVTFTIENLGLAIIRLDRLDSDSDEADAEGISATVMKPEYLP